jgi:hypothetical protein
VDGEAAMTVYIGVKMTVNGILDERIEVSFNTSDGGLGLRFYDEGTDGTQETISYAAAKQLITVLETAFEMRARKEKT